MKYCTLIQLFFITFFLGQVQAQNWKLDFLTTKDSIKIAYATIGNSNNPALIYVHGGPGGNCADFFSFAEQLSEKYFVVLYDQRGGGLSERKIKTGKVTIDKMINDLYELQQQLKLKKTILIGHSFGGVIAQEYALKYNNKVDRLIIMDGLIDSKLSMESRINSVQKIAERENNDEVKKIIQLYRINGRIDKNFMRLIFSEQRPYWYEFKPEYKKINNWEKLQRLGYTNDNIQTSRFVEMEYFKSGFIQNYSFLKKANNLKVNTILIFGEHDGITTVKDAEILDSLLVNCELISIEKCGHYPYKEKPEKLKDILFNQIGK